MSSERQVTERWTDALQSLPTALQALVRRGEPMARHSTLRVGGPAALYVEAYDIDNLAAFASLAQSEKLPCLLIGEGSNLCVHDSGFDGLVLRNACSSVELGELTRVDTGVSIMSLSVRAMQAGLSGLEFAVGIPGTVGGALVSNAGAYRASIGDLVRRIEIVEGGARRWVGPEWMEFSYRDSRLRNGGGVAALLAVELSLTRDRRAAIRGRAAEIQRQRIFKQPWLPSAGSFFKNVNDPALAERVPGLPGGLRQAGVVPAAYLSEACGLKGFRIGGAGISARHANFVVNLGGATAADIRAVADEVQARVQLQFGVWLEEEVLTVGEWREPSEGGE